MNYHLESEDAVCTTNLMQNHKISNNNKKPLIYFFFIRINYDMLTYVFHMIDLFKLLQYNILIQSTHDKKETYRKRSNYRPVPNYRPPPPV